MRILHLSWGLGLGGAEALLSDLANIQSTDHDVAVAAINDDVSPAVRNLLCAGVQRIELRRPAASRNPWHLLRASAAIRSWRPDVIHAHQTTLGRLRTFLRRPMIVTVHGLGAPVQGSLREFSAVCCISEAVRRDVTTRGDVKATRVIENGIRFEDIVAKRCYGGRPVKIVQLGRLDHAIKGQDLLLDALHLLACREPELDVELHFIGDGQSKVYLEARALELGLGARVHFRGALERRLVYEQLASFDLLVQPSRSEGFGLALVEGLAAGLPVVGASGGGMDAIIGKDELGWLFRNGSTESLADALARAIAAEGKPGFGVVAQKRRDVAHERFDVSRTAAEYMEVYAHVARGDTRSPGRT